MTQEEYGHAYLEARDVLYRRGKAVGKPQFKATGRVCPIDGNLLSDLGLFREAWGESVAHELTINTYISVTAEAVLPNCCDKLWRECLAANRDLLALIKRSREDQLQAAVEMRRRTRAALLAHAATHPKDLRAR